MLPVAGTKVQISNSAFLAELARGAANGTSLWVNHFEGEPDEGKGHQWAGTPYSAATMASTVDAWGSVNSYFCVAALRRDQGGGLKRRKSHFDRLLVLVADDIHLEDIQGVVSYVIQTSPQKHQVGIFLDESDPMCADVDLVDSVMKALAARGAVRLDKSGNSATRYVRLPIGQNQKPRDSGHWNHQVVIWSPHVRLGLADAAAAFGVDLDDLQPTRPDSEAPREGQGEKLRRDLARILRGEVYHDSINEVGASLIACGLQPGAVVNLLRGVMDALPEAAKDDRWASRYQDIPRSVSGAVEKFQRTFEAPVDPSGFKLRRSAVDFSRLPPVQWVIDGFLASGQVAVFAGQPGVGKSTVFASMALLVAGYGEQMGSDIAISRPRKVVIVSEHSEQYARLFYGACRRFKIDAQELARQIILFDAARLTPREIPREVLRLIREHTDKEPPLVKLDTASSSFDVSDENSNAEVGAVMAALKQPVIETGAPLWIVAHAAKALGREDAEITPRGASAYIGDVHATGSVFRDKNFPSSTFIKSLKNRNEREFGEIEVQTAVYTFDSEPTEDGEIQAVGIRLGVPMRSGEEVRREAAQEAREARDQADDMAKLAELDRRVLAAFSGENAGKLMSVDALATAVRGKRTAALERIEELIQAGELTRHPWPQDLKTHHKQREFVIPAGLDVARFVDGVRRLALRSQGAPK